MHRPLTTVEIIERDVAMRFVEREEAKRRARETAEGPFVLTRAEPTSPVVKDEVAEAAHQAHMRRESARHTRDARLSMALDEVAHDPERSFESEVERYAQQTAELDVLDRGWAVLGAAAAKRAPQSGVRPSTGECARVELRMLEEQIANQPKATAEVVERAREHARLAVENARAQTRESKQLQAIVAKRREVDNAQANEPKRPALTNPLVRTFGLTVSGVVGFILSTGFVAAMAAWGAIMVAWYDEQSGMIDGPYGTADTPYIHLMLAAAAIPSVLTLIGRFLIAARDNRRRMRQHRKAHVTWQRRKADIEAVRLPEIAQAEAALEALRRQHAGVRAQHE